MNCITFNEKSKVFCLTTKNSMYQMQVGAGFRQFHSHKTSYKIATNRLNSGFFNVKTCQVFKKYLLYMLYGVVLCVIIRYET